MATCVVDEPYARGSEAESNSCDTFKELEHVIIVYIIMSSIYIITDTAGSTEDPQLQH